MARFVSFTATGKGGISLEYTVDADLITGWSVETKERRLPDGGTVVERRVVINGAAPLPSPELSPGLSERFLAYMEGQGTAHSLDRKTDQAGGSVDG